ncbi:ABC-type transport system, substrate-binding protein [Cyclonatronum proteinivorum]|uniref:ABC-type transport system, substrate-binding protein n=1 Tax=Cyclonatronum proteinivorum TaxID=1457365 RepID=A0A345UHJ7_9BACT|nr:ABC transporter substrate-binding protein [Cyclonatronum proteinivorum]AXI99948.1 ABC-type transport system, substrate-binding protein [Cyclonatronum proteinivorum]
MKKSYLSKALLLIILVVSAQSLFAQQGTLRYTEDAQFARLHPYDNASERANTARIFSLIFEPLFTYDYNLEQFEYALAKEILVQQPRKVVIRLKDNVKWHDGKNFSADDVYFTFDKAMNFNRNEAVRNRLSGLIENINILSDDQVEFVFKEDVRDPKAELSFIWIVPKHRLEGDNATDFIRNPIGTGPYRVSEFNMSGITFEHFPDYHGTIRDIGKIVRRQTIDLDARITELLSNATDLLINVPANRVRQIAERGMHNLIPYQSFSISTIAFNYSNSMLGNRNVREAMVRGFNRERVLNTWYNGRGSLIGGPLTPGAPFFNPNVQPLPYEPARARQLLADAGFSDRNNDGFLQDANGNRLRFSMVVRDLGANTNDPSLRNVVQDFIDEMRNIGIEIQIVNLTYDDFRQRVFESRDFDLAVMEIFFDPTYDISPLFFSRSVFSEFNVTGYSNRAVDARFESFFNSESRSERMELMSSIQEIIARDIPYIFMFTLERNAAINLRFYNVRVDPFYFFNEVNYWRVQDL